MFFSARMVLLIEIQMPLGWPTSLPVSGSFGLPDSYSERLAVSAYEPRSSQAALTPSEQQAFRGPGSQSPIAEHRRGSRSPPSRGRTPASRATPGLRPAPSRNPVRVFPPPSLALRSAFSARPSPAARRRAVPQGCV